MDYYAKLWYYGREKEEKLYLDSKIARELIEENQYEKWANTMYIKGQRKGVRETALNMLRDKVDPKTISKYTGLSIEELKSLK